MNPRRPQNVEDNHLRLKAWRWPSFSKIVLINNQKDWYNGESESMKSKEDDKRERKLA